MYIPLETFVRIRYGSIRRDSVICTSGRTFADSETKYVRRSQRSLVASERGIVIDAVPLQKEERLPVLPRERETAYKKLRIRAHELLTTQNKHALK